jgi:hypothetical protein
LVCEQHLDLLAVPPGLRERVGLGKGTSNVAGFLVDIAWQPILYSALDEHLSVVPTAGY